MTDFLSIPSKRVSMQDGSLAAVNEFRIGKHPVSKEAFASFIDDTGYRLSSYEEVLLEFEDVPLYENELEPDATYASYVSWKDANAYCQWVGGRLPSEVEWLAFSLIEDGVCETVNEYFDGLQRLVAMGVEYHGLEWTSTRLDGKYVARSWPRFKLCEPREAWKSTYRQLFDEDHAANFLGFRLVLE